MKKNTKIKQLVGKNIRYYRKLKGLTIEKLAELANLSSKYLGSVERGENNISIENLEKLAVSLNLEIYKLFIIHTKSSQELHEIIDMLEKINDRRLPIYKNIIKDIITAYEKEE